MLTSIFAENFKSLKARQVFEMRQFTILTGTNNSGKSTMIQILKLFQIIFSKQPSLAQLTSGEVDLQAIGREFGGFENLFNKGCDKEELLTLGFCQFDSELNTELQYSFSFTQGAQLKFFSLHELGKKSEAAPLFELDNKDFLCHVHYDEWKRIIKNKIDGLNHAVGYLGFIEETILEQVGEGQVKLQQIAKSIYEKAVKNLGTVQVEATPGESRFSKDLKTLYLSVKACGISKGAWDVFAEHYLEDKNFDYFCGKLAEKGPSQFSHLIREKFEQRELLEHFSSKKREWKKLFITELVLPEFISQLKEIESDLKSFEIESANDVLEKYGFRLDVSIDEEEVERLIDEEEYDEVANRYPFFNVKLMNEVGAELLRDVKEAWHKLIITAPSLKNRNPVRLFDFSTAMNLADNQIVASYWESFAKDFGFENIQDNKEGFLDKLDDFLIEILSVDGFDGDPDIMSIDVYSDVQKSKFQALFGGSERWFEEVLRFDLGSMFTFKIGRFLRDSDDPFDVNSHLNQTRMAPKVTEKFELDDILLNELDEPNVERLAEYFIYPDHRDVCDVSEKRKLLKLFFLMVIESKGLESGRQLAEWLNIDYQQNETDRSDDVVKKARAIKKLLDIDVLSGNQYNIEIFSKLSTDNFKDILFLLDEHVITQKICVQLFSNISSSPALKTPNQRNLRLSDSDALAKSIRTYFYHKKYHGEVDYNIRMMLNKLGIANDFSIEVNVQNDSFQVFLNQGKNKILLQDNGHGIVQLFPVLVALACEANSGLDWLGREIEKRESSAEINWWSKRPSIVMIIEEPELSLHPAIQSRLADVLATIQEFNHVRLLIETHSEYFIRKLQYLVAKKEIPSESMRLYYFNSEMRINEDPKLKRVYKIDFKKDGTLSESFGPGFFDEADNIAFDLFLLSNDYEN